MKYLEISEHNSGDQGTPLPGEFFNKNSNLLISFSLNNEDYEIRKFTVDNQIFYPTYKMNTNIIVAYVFIEKFDTLVWQVKGSYIYDVLLRGKGLGSRIYLNIASFDNKILISDDQLSAEAEKLWVKSLPLSGREIKIYDSVTKNKHSFNEIGEKTKDEVNILDPKEDNPLNSGEFRPVRFYYLLENFIKNGDLYRDWKNKKYKNQIYEHITKNRSINLAGKSWY